MQTGKYKLYKVLFNKTVRAMETEYYKAIFDTKVNSMKRIWSELNTMGRVSNNKKRENVINKIKVHGTEIRTSDSMCDEFNDYFCKISERILESVPKSNDTYERYMPSPLGCSIFIQPIDKEELKTEIRNMNPRKSSGDDNISVKLIQDSCDNLIDPLLIIYNKSLTEGVVPDQMKIAKVIPVYKKDERYLTKNYRPISLLSNFDKVAYLKD